MRDPGTLGNALLMLRQAQKRGIVEIADEVDRGVLGALLVHPAFLNGRSSERLEAIQL